MFFNGIPPDSDIVTYIVLIVNYILHWG